MFFDAFAAEAVVRQAKGGPESIVKALAAPLHAKRKELVIGAIDDDHLLEQLLPRLEDCTSVKACLMGRCGSPARIWAEEHCRGLWSRVGEEARRARFRVYGEETNIVEFEGGLAEPLDLVRSGVFRSVARTLGGWALSRRDA